jgi:hypothetical protein
VDPSVSSIHFLAVSLLHPIDDDTDDTLRTDSNGLLDTSGLHDTLHDPDKPAPPSSLSLIVPSLSSVALVANPPIPFAPNSVIRGRRTMSPTALLGTLFSPKGRVRKVHCCPAENCGAAFKRSEHLKRHYRAVHVGAKREFHLIRWTLGTRTDDVTYAAFPCDWISCGKSFSRKDNLQQHVRPLSRDPFSHLDD